MNPKRLLLASVILTLALASSACGIVSVSTEGGELTVSVNVSEEQVNGIIGRATTAAGNRDDFLFDETTGVDLLEPNLIRVFGTANGEAGSYDMTMDAVDESLKIEVVAVDIPGVTMDDPRVQQANDDLAQAFLDNVRTGDEGGVADVAVVGDELRFTFRAAIER